MTPETPLQRSHLTAVHVFLLLLSSCGPVHAEDLETSTRLGPVSATVRLSPGQPVIGDLLELQITVIAERQVEVLMPEFGEALSRFQIVDFSPREQLGKDGQITFLQKYKLQSPPSGSHAIPPILIEFVDRRPGEEESPKGRDAYELLTERVNFEVQSVIVDNVSANLNPPLGRLEKNNPETSSAAQGWQAIVLIGGILAVAGSVAWWAFRFRRRVIRRSAYEIAKRKLDRLLASPRPGKLEIEAFYVQITLIVRQYLENRFDLRAPELTTEEFLAAVRGSAELSPEHQRLLDGFLKHADLVKFAGVEPTAEEIADMVQKASRFLDETSKNSPMIPDPDQPEANLPIDGKGAGTHHV
ncbi:MAG: hypothetical protein VX768_13685 [Planctomycetota bacterium]|nr:hypothetical protein [Planctomycetota bacterium]